MVPQCRLYGSATIDTRHEFHTSRIELELFLVFARPSYSQNMKVSIRLMAMPTAAGSTQGLKPAPLALLPPIPLYRRLLRSHRKYLPKEQRVFGDEYVKREFRLHQKVENPIHIVRILEFS